MNDITSLPRPHNGTVTNPRRPLARGVTRRFL
jgi:hypothetical protein